MKPVRRKPASARSHQRGLRRSGRSPPNAAEDSSSQAMVRWSRDRGGQQQRCVQSAVIRQNKEAARLPTSAYRRGRSTTIACRSARTVIARALRATTLIGIQMLPKNFPVPILRANGKPVTSILLLYFIRLFGAPGEIRTPDPLVRSQVLYPTELRALRARIIHPVGSVRALSFASPARIRGRRWERRGHEPEPDATTDWNGKSAALSIAGEW